MFHKLCDFLKGRHTVLAVFFTIMGTLLEWFHRLTPEYVALIGAIQGLVTIHSIKEDYFSKDKDSPGDSK